MRRRAFLALAVLVAFPLTARAQASIAGTIEQIDAGRGVIRIRTRDGVLEGRISAQTWITIAGSPGELRDLRAGQHVVAQFAVTQSGAPRPELVRLEVR